MLQCNKLIVVVCNWQSGVGHLPAFQDDRLSEQHYRQAGVRGQGSWDQGQGQPTAPWQSYYHYYTGPGGHGSPMVSEVTSTYNVKFFLLEYLQIVIRMCNMWSLVTKWYWNSSKFRSNQCWWWQRVAVGSRNVHSLFLFMAHAGTVVWPTAAAAVHYCQWRIQLWVVRAAASPPLTKT